MATTYIHVEWLEISPAHWPPFLAIAIYTRCLQGPCSISWNRWIHMLHNRTNLSEPLHHKQHMECDRLTPSPTEARVLVLRSKISGLHNLTTFLTISSIKNRPAPPYTLFPCTKLCAVTFKVSHCFQHWWCLHQRSFSAVASSASISLPRARSRDF